jgi:tyrosyl-tRNA synthetase
MSNNIFEELKWRGLVYDHIPGVEQLLERQKVTLYNGFDVTADSLHVGHLVPLIGLARFQQFGHSPIALAGGGTTMIGDPSGKSSERILLSREQIEYNLGQIKTQLARFLDFESKSNPARIVNNADWLASLNLVGFLRDIGKYFSVNYMITKESVKTRLEREDGISFTEFTYMLMQAYDFYHLNTNENCILQTGGSDQWGNITAGVELIRRKNGSSVYGLVYPLITKADGTKFGKTESGTLWLSPKRTSPYHFYQFWLNTDDKDVVRYLKFFTWLDKQKILELEESTIEHPELRMAQRALADEMTRLVHDESALARSQQATEALFGGDIDGFTANEIEEVFANVPHTEIHKNILEGSGLSIVDLLEKAKVSSSKSDARRLVAEGAIYLNNRRISEFTRSITLMDTIDAQYLLLRKGKKNFHLIKIIGD